jgi:hypothetical protein
MFATARAAGVRVGEYGAGYRTGRRV